MVVYLWSESLIRSLAQKQTIQPIHIILWRNLTGIVCAGEKKINWPYSLCIYL